VYPTAPVLRTVVAQDIVTNNANKFGIDGRAWLTIDTATNTAYGPATSEAQFNFSADNAGMPTNYGNGAGLDHAWFKWAGLEGHVADGSLFNVGANHAPTDGFGAPDIGGAAWLGYVGQFGGGFTAGISIEDPIGHRATVFAPVGNPTTAVGVVGVGGSDVYSGSQFPDVAAKVAVSQGWGSAALSGIIHQTNLSSASPNGSYSKMGYGIAAAVAFKATSAVTFDLSANYTYGLAKVFSQGVGSPGLYASGTGSSGGAQYVIVDAMPVLAGGGWNGSGGYATPNAWGINAGVSFAATPALTLTPYASYGALNYNADPIFFSKTLKAWNVGLDTSWSPVSSINVDLNVLYTSINASTPTAAVNGPFNNAWNNTANGFLGRLQIKRTF